MLGLPLGAQWRYEFRLHRGLICLKMHMLLYERHIMYYIRFTFCYAWCYVWYLGHNESMNTWYTDNQDTK